MRFIIPLIIFLSTVGLLWKSLALKPTELPSVLVGHPAPSFNLKTVEDSTKNVTEAIFKGHVTILNVWASWCASCKKEHLVWMDLFKKHNIFMIGVNYSDDLKEAQQWLQKEGNPYHITIFDKEGRLGMDYGVYGVPETFILDKEGIVRYRQTGPINTQLWQQLLLPLIENLNHS